MGGASREAVGHQKPEFPRTWGQVASLTDSPHPREGTTGCDPRRAWVPAGELLPWKDCGRWAPWIAGLPPRKGLFWARADLILGGPQEGGLRGVRKQGVQAAVLPPPPQLARCLQAQVPLTPASAPGTPSTCPKVCLDIETRNPFCAPFSALHHPVLFWIRVLFNPRQGLPSGKKTLPYADAAQSINT